MVWSSTNALKDVSYGCVSPGSLALRFLRMDVQLHPFHIMMVPIILRTNIVRKSFSGSKLICKQYRH